MKVIVYFMCFVWKFEWRKKSNNWGLNYIRLDHSIATRKGFIWKVKIIAELEKEVKFNWNMKLSNRISWKFLLLLNTLIVLPTKVYGQYSKIYFFRALKNDWKGNSYWLSHVIIFVWMISILMLNIFTHWINF